MAKLLGMHDEEGSHIVPNGGWCLALTELSNSPSPRIYDPRLNWLVRANWGYGTTGTIPLRNEIDQYTFRLGNFASSTANVHGYIIGNEPNHEQERPNGVYITPEHYADCFIRSYQLLKSMSSLNRVIVAAMAPYHADGRPWIQYLREVLKLIGDRVTPDGISLHAYTRSMNPQDIDSDDEMGGVLGSTYSGFRTYEDAIEQIPTDMRRIPLYITEFNVLPVWEDRNTGVIQAAAKNIQSWNARKGTQKIYCLITYRWPHDKWAMKDKPELLKDFALAASLESSQNNVETGHGSDNTVLIPSIKNAPKPPSSPSTAFERQIDERATARGVSLVESNTASWKVKRIEWLDKEQSQGRHHIYFDVLDEQGNRIVGIPIKVIWPTGFHTVKTEAKSGEPYSANFPMSPSRNEFSVMIDGQDSEMVRGIGMGADLGSGFNASEHTSTVVFFQKVGKGENPLTEPPREEAKPVQFPTLVHPVSDPIYRYVTQGWGLRPEFYGRYRVDGVPLKGHNGIDYGTPVGSNILAVDRGRVVEVANDVNGYGLYVKLVHDWGESLYAHLSVQLVTVGTTVSPGQIIGKSGNTGNSSGPHLHFGMRVAPFNRKDGWGGYTNPAPYLSNTAPVVVQEEEDVLNAIKMAADETGLDWRLLASLAWAESSFNPDALSGAGAMGLFQLMVPTWEEWSDKVGGEDPFNPLHNARVGAYYFLWCLGQVQSNTYKALWAYNWGVGNVTTGRTPPVETTKFADKVMHGYDLLVETTGG
jgi:hypothetical protein